MRTVEDLVSYTRIKLREIEDRVWPTEGIIDAANVTLAKMALRSRMFTQVADFVVEAGKKIYVAPKNSTELLSAKLDEQPIGILPASSGSKKPFVARVENSLRLYPTPTQNGVLEIYYAYSPLLEALDEELNIPPHALEALSLGTLYQCAQRESGERFVEKISFYKKLFEAEVSTLDFYTKKIVQQPHTTELGGTYF